MNIATVIRKIIESENQLSDREKIEIISEIVNMIDNQEITKTFVNMISDKEMDMTLSNVDWLGCYAALELSIKCFDMCIEDDEDDVISEKSAEEMKKDLESIRDVIYQNITGEERDESMSVFEMLYPLMGSITNEDASTTIELTVYQSNHILTALSMAVDMKHNGMLGLLEFMDIDLPLSIATASTSAFDAVLKNYSDVFAKQLADLLVAYIDSRIQGVKF